MPLKALIFEFFMKADKDSTINMLVTMLTAMGITSAPYLLRFLIIQMSGESGELEDEERPTMFQNEW